MKREIKKIIVHCSDSPWGDVEVIRHWHSDPKPQGNGWSDIGYHAVILNGHRKNSADFDENIDGLIEMGRPLEKSGAHCYAENKHSFGICLIGVEAFTVNQYYSLRQLIDVWRQLYGVPTNMIAGHRDFQRTSKGKRKTCPNFDVGSWLYTMVAA